MNGSAGVMNLLRLSVSPGGKTHSLKLSFYSGSLTKCSGRSEVDRKVIRSFSCCYLTSPQG